MYYQLFQFVFLLGFYTINSSGNDKLLCYSCKGNECEQITNNDKNKIICNKKTQLCWAGFIDQQPYRTCASRYCTPSDFSLDSDIHIETCCRSNLCNSVSLSWPTRDKSLSHRIESTTTQTILQRNTATKMNYFVDEIIDEILYFDEEGKDVTLSKLQLNASDSNSFRISWDRLSYDTDFSNRIASISSILLFLMPLLLVLLL